MSALLHIKGIILTHMTAEPELKDAVLGIINCVDKDLDSMAYDEDIISDETEAAIKNLDEVLVGEGDDDKEIEKDVIIKKDSPLDDDEVDYAADPNKEGTE